MTTTIKSSSLFGELEDRLNWFGLTLLMTSYALALTFAGFYCSAIFVFTIDVCEKTSPDWFVVPKKFLNICSVPTFIFVCNAAILLVNFKTQEFKWTPRSDLAFTCLLASNIVSVIIGIVLTIIDYGNIVAILTAFAIIVPAFIYFLTTISKEDLHINSPSTEKISISESCSHICAIVWMMIQFLILIINGNPKSVDRSDYLTHRNMIASMFILTIFNIINYFPSNMLGQQFKKSGFIYTTKYHLLDIINGILMFSQFVIVFFFLHSLSKIMIALLIESIVHAILYVIKMHLFIRYEEQISLEEKERQEKATLKNRQDLVDDFLKRLQKIIPTIFSADPSIHQPSFGTLKSYYVRYQELNDLFTKNITHQIIQNERYQSVYDFKNRLEALEKDIQVLPYSNSEQVDITKK